MSLDGGGFIGFLGAGNMAEAIIRGLTTGGGVPGSRIGASAPRPERRAELAERYGIVVSADNAELARRADILVLAVKPQIMSKVLDQIQPALRPETLVISVAAGVPVAAIEARLPAFTRVIRTMPNTPAIVDAGATANAAGSRATAEDLATATAIFEAVGYAVVLDEGQLDAVTGLSGSGPAYVFLMLEALADAGVKQGLSRRTA
jgi:pyrroline-5-carboxylate reductase